MSGAPCSMGSGKSLGKRFQAAARAAPALILLLSAMPLAAEPVEDAEVRAAVEKSLDLIQRSTAEYREQRACFSCHHSAIPTFTLLEARERGLAVDAENLVAQFERAHDHLRRGKSSYTDGNGQGGKADTAGYALWTLEAGGRPADEVTEAVTSYLARWQQDDEHWSCTSHRPPSEASDITTSYLAIRGLEHFGTEAQRPRIQERRDQLLQWLLQSRPEDTEDHVFRVRALSLLDAETDVVRAAVESLLKQQRADGGWAQTAEMESDAYATGTVLAALHEYGHVAADDARYQRGLRFLLGSQQPDGSWHVVSRSKPFQTYFESGFPHGKDQFISIAASSWATLALLYHLPADKQADQ